MKTVGKQLEEARVGKGWTPERAARETKIRVDRLRDLEGDEYAHFTSPAYARGFVRTYARALGLDEYRILRQLDNKLPEEDHSTFHDTGLPYIPEPSNPSRPAGSYTGLYVILGMGAAVLLILGFILFQAYRAGELRSYFAQDNSGADTISSAAATNAAAAAAQPARAMPVETATVATSTNQPPRALPVDASALATPADTNAAPAAVVSAPSAAVTNTVAATPPRALPVDLATLDNGNASTPAPAAKTDIASTPAPETVTPPRALPVDLATLAATSPASVAAPAHAPAAPGAEGDFANTTGKRLVLAASHASFIRVTDLDDPSGQKVVYASTLESGQSIGFNGHRFSINVEVPSAVGITLDGVNYGPHSDHDTPDTFTVESHQP